nr:hypothetical protein [Tanacetum cinerariifolium]
MMTDKEKGAVLDAEAEAFLADVECTAPYDQPLALTTTNLFEANHEDAYDSDAVPTVVSADEADKQSMIAVLQRMHTEIACYVKVKDKHKLVNATLTDELERCKIEMQALERNKVKHDLDMAIVERNKRNAELEEENVMLKSTLKSKVVSIENLQQESIQVLSEKKTLENKCYEELSKANTHLRTTSLEKTAVQKAEIATLNAKTVGNKTSGTTKPANPKKQVTFQETPKPSPRFTKKPVAPLLKKLNINVPLSTGIKSATGASKSASKSNAWIYRKLPAKSAKGEKVEEHIRNLNKNNHVDSHVKRFVFVKNLNAVYGACHECLISSNHDNCLVYFVKSVNHKQPKAKNTMRTTKKVWRPKVVTSVEPMWKPTRRHFTLYDSYPLTRILEPTVEPIELSPSVSSSTKFPMLSKFVAVTLGIESSTDCSLVFESECSRHMTDDRSKLINYVEKFIGTFCDGGLEVAFRQHTWHIRNMDKVDLLQASSTKSWLWHRRLNHLNFRTLNELARKDLVRGLPLLKYDKDHLCPSCQLGKSKKASHPLKTENNNVEILSTLHMDLYRPMRSESINKKKYVLVIVDDYIRFGWVRFLRTKDETPEVFLKFLKNTQRALNVTVRTVRTDNGTEFIKKTLTDLFESVGITRQTSIPRIIPPKAMYEARMREIIRDQITTSMAGFVENMNRGNGGAGGGGAEAGGAEASGAGAGGAGPAAPEITGCTYITFMKDKVKFETATLQGLALTWWNGRIASMGIDAANGTSWTEVRKWMTEEFCPRSVLQRLDQELYNLKLKGTDIDGYTNRFHELALLCPRMVEPEQVKVEQYIRGLLKNIDVTSSRPAGIDEAV